MSNPTAIAIRRTAQAAFFVMLASSACDAAAGWADGVSAYEKSQMPIFCYSQMEVPGAVGPQYDFPAGCGAGMNHYCPGLVKLIRAKRERNKGQALKLLDGALGSASYTMRWLKQENALQTCAIRPHVEATIAEIERLKRVYSAMPNK